MKKWYKQECVWHLNTQPECVPEVKEGGLKGGTSLMTLDRRSDFRGTFFMPWHFSGELPIAQYEQISIVFGVWPFWLAGYFSVNNILAGLWLNYISSVEITLILLHGGPLQAGDCSRLPPKMMMTETWCQVRPQANLTMFQDMDCYDFWRASRYWVWVTWYNNGQSLRVRIA